MNPLETYLKEVQEIHATGESVAETSYYPALSGLFDEIGKALKPKVRSVMNLKDRGAGMPDGGFFTATQYRRQADHEPREGQKPERGAIEAKGPKQAIEAIILSEQVERYCREYNQLLVTNLRDFLLLAFEQGKPKPLERFRLADNEAGFWEAARHPRRTATFLGERFCEYLKRVMLSNAPLTDPKDVAWFLASYARDARDRVEHHKDLSALDSVRRALEEALGMRFTDERGEHFFRSTLVQTVFYGIFSAWVMWHRENPDRTDAFNWHEAEWSLHVPFIRALYDEIATPSKLGPLDLVEVLDWTGAALDRVDREAFFRKFRDEHAVQYFYEPFLEAFDPQLRKELGVWYTPPEIVRYQVARVDAVLREELDVEDGLADPGVVVLDPCCGTGAYLVEVLRRIEETLREKGTDALLPRDVKRAATERVFGFEVLPAPFVVAHLQVGSMLRQLGAPLSVERNERVGVYLTNALTGWEPPKEPKTKLMFPELEAERDAADHIKRAGRILVILGNPPYNGFAGVAVDEERALSEAYRTTQRAPAPQGQGLNDLYVRFFRMAERRIVEMNDPPMGVVCFISNYSWLDGLSFTGMRERYLDAFDAVWVDCLNGDKYKTGKLTPDGEPDPSVFSTQFNREGIQVGTAVALLTLRKQEHRSQAEVRFRHFWGKTKLAELADAAVRPEQTGFSSVKPAVEMGLSLMPSTVKKVYFTWPRLPELFPVSFPGVKTSRDEFLVDIDRDRLLERLRVYFDPDVNHETVRREFPDVMKDRARYKAESIRNTLLARGMREEHIIRYCYRPFDVRWLYWEPETKLLDEKREDYRPHVFDGNVWIEARQRQPKEQFDRGYLTKLMADNFGNGLSSYFPLRLSGPHLPHRGDLFDGPAPTGKVANLSEEATAYLERLKRGPEDLFFHALGSLHAPAYRKENAGALRQDWPRVPLPDSGEALEASAALGRKVAALLDSESEVPRVTTGKIGALYQSIGRLTVRDSAPLDPESDLAVTAGWGHSGKGGATMPGKGLVVERRYDSDERQAIAHGAADEGLDEKRAFSLLGRKTFDVFLNDRVCWKNIPAAVWEYHIGGYQVIKKWLSYRERKVLGRALREDEVREVMNIARRIAALVLMGPALDANYGEVKANARKV